MFCVLVSKKTPAMFRNFEGKGKIFSIIPLFPFIKSMFSDRLFRIILLMGTVVNPDKLLHLKPAYLNN